MRVNSEIMFGVDIEDSGNLPDYFIDDEFRFFVDNFTQSEIEYVLNKKPDDTKKYFTCLYSMKEAIVKANNYYKPRRFNTIGITFSLDGRPMLDGFLLSYSYVNNTCVALAYLSLEDR
jgi:phosphopantetheine--protein transferase-like protein